MVLICPPGHLSLSPSCWLLAFVCSCPCPFLWPRLSCSLMLSVLSRCPLYSCLLYFIGLFLPGACWLALLALRLWRAGPASLPTLDYGHPRAHHTEGPRRQWVLNSNLGCWVFPGLLVIWRHSCATCAWTLGPKGLGYLWSLGLTAPE